MDRRSFVKACVTTAGVGALAASGLGMAAGLAIPRKPGLPPVRYFGAHRVAGPAPRGIPYIPVAIEGGTIVGRTSIPNYEAGEPDINILEWYKYCGHSIAPGLVAGTREDENGLKYFIAEDKIASVNPWYGDRLANPIRADEFPDNEFGAGFIWRSDGQSGPNVLTGAIIRYKTKAVKHLTSGITNPGKSLPADRMQLVRDQIFATVGDSTFVAISTFCTHFCCIPGYKEAEKLARPRNAWDKVFCTCHNSVYDPREPVAYSFFPEPVKVEEGAATSSGASAGGGGH